MLTASTARFCALFGIEVPLLQSGMGGIAGPDLTAAVSNAGALGILAGHAVALDDLREAIRATKALTNRPFGVNLLIPDDLARPITPSPDLVREVQAKHNAIRESLGIPEKAAPPDPPVDLSAKIDLLLDERISVLSFGLGDPGQELVGRCRSLGIKTIAMVSTVADAKAVEQAGIDAVIAQGSEAGGHRSHFQKPESPQKGAVGTMTLVPAVCDAVSVPVVAAGGIADGRGIAAALALGAAGVMLGTRFVATQESMAVTAYKEAVLRAGANDSRISDAASGRYARLIENDLLDRLEQAPKLPFMWQSSAVSDILDEARRRNDGGMLALWAGQSSSLINDLPSAAEMVSRLMDQTRQVIDSLK